MLNKILMLFVGVTLFSCGGGSGGESPSSSSLSQTGAVTKFEGKYIQTYENASTSSLIVIGFSIEGSSITTLSMTFPDKSDLSYATYEKNIGTFSLNGNTIDIKYSYESCNPVKSESFKIFGDAKDMISIQQGDTTLTFFNDDKYDVGIDHKKIKVMKEECASETVSVPTSPVGTGQTQVSAQNYSSILNQVSCRTGNYNGFKIGNRLQTVYTFHTTGNTSVNGSQTTISGPFSQGGVDGSDVSRVYLGVGYYGDVLLVQKVVQGSQVIGYNVMVSYCSMTSSTGAPFITDSRPISAFQGSITIDDEVSCGHGMIDHASTRAVSQTDPNYSYLPTFNADTIFNKVGCVNF